MKKLLYILIASLLGVSSCNVDVLDKQPLDVISDLQLWEDPALIDAYMADVYRDMGFIGDMQYLGNRNWFDFTYTITMADEAAPGWENGKRVNILNTGSTASYNQWWGYPLVRKMNVFLERMPTAALEPAAKEQKIAEIRFLRAYAYFNMVKRYGGVPLITEAQPLDAPREELAVSRDNEAIVYDFILSEIDALMPDLQPHGQGDKGRPSQAAALALKSRAAMYAASIAQWGKVQLDGVVGIPADRAKAYWQTSYDASKAIMDGGKFTLYNRLPDNKSKNYQNIFLDENNSEVIFSEIYSGPGGRSHSWDHVNSPAGYNAWGLGGQISAYLEMVEEYENVDGSSGVIDRSKIANGYLWTAEELFGKKDPRFHGSIITQGDVWLGDTLETYRAIRTEDGTIIRNNYKELNARGRATMNAEGTTPFQALKYLDESIARQGAFGQSSTDWIVFRYAEVLLNHAEAAFELDKPAEALASINEIRERAGMPLLSVVDRDKIRHERKIELAFEGNRYWDVRRWRIAEQALSVKFSSVEFVIDYATRKYQLRLIPDFEIGRNPVFSPRHYYLPITIDRISNNSNLVENPGY